MDEIEIREELARTVAEDPNNIDKILKLSHELASLDKNNVRFSVDSGVIDRLGKELVARHETAVSELVKNAYDAHASLSSLQFLNVDYEGGTLIIDDDGTGMTRDQLINGFMRISSTSKIHEPISPVYGRSRAGKKGIGRFSTQRLGNKLTIITQTKESETALKIVVDWRKYLMDDDLFVISNKIEEIPKQKEQGTTLIIEDLREWWSEAMIKRVYRYSIDVVQPFPISNAKNDSIEDPGFKIYCSMDGREIASQQSMIYEHAVAEIDGFLDEKGKGFCLTGFLSEIPPDHIQVTVEAHSAKADFCLPNFVSPHPKEMCFNAELNQIANEKFKTYSFTWVSNQNVPQQNAKSNLEPDLKLPVYKKRIYNSASLS